jgi:ribosomal protein S27E
MDWLRRFSLWMNRVMAGRYGADQLTFALLIAYGVLILIARFISFYFLSLAALLILVWCFYRMLSRNLSARWRENERFLKFWRSVAGWFRHLRNRVAGAGGNASQRVRDRKTHRYFRCPKCKNTLRVPKGKGKIAITCPVCGTEFIKKT